MRVVLGDKLTRVELIALVQRITNPEISDGEADRLCELLEANVPHPAPTDLVFGGRGHDELSAVQVVEQALSYKPVSLPKT